MHPCTFIYVCDGEHDCLMGQLGVTVPGQRTFSHFPHSNLPSKLYQLSCATNAGRYARPSTRVIRIESIKNGQGLVLPYAYHQYRMNRFFPQLCLKNEIKEVDPLNAVTLGTGSIIVKHSKMLLHATSATSSMTAIKRQGDELGPFFGHNPSLTACCFGQP